MRTKVVKQLKANAIAIAKSTGNYNLNMSKDILKRIHNKLKKKYIARRTAVKIKVFLAVGIKETIVSGTAKNGVIKWIKEMKQHIEVCPTAHKARRYCKKRKEFEVIITKQ